MAGIDNALQVVEEQGDYLFTKFQINYLRMLTELSECRNLSFLPLDARQDIGKLIIVSAKAGLSGQQIYDILLKKYHLQLEMAAPGYCLAMFTIGDGEEAYRRMTDALLAIDRDITAGNGRADRSRTAEKRRKSLSISCIPKCGCPLPRLGMPKKKKFCCHWQREESQEIS